MFNETLPNIPAPAPPDDYTEDGPRVQYVADLLAQATKWDNAVKRVRRRLQDKLARGTSVPPPSGGGSGSRRKFPTPGKYKGGIGDPAITFISQCQNYLQTEGRGWEGNDKVHWALQFLEGKAGPWAELQLRRMEEEIDGDGNEPQELREWNEFMNFFKTQWYDSGSIINA